MINSWAMTCPIRRYIRRSGRRSWSWESTNLSLRGNGYEDGYGAASGANQPENQQRGHGVNGTRLNEHGDDGPAQSTTSSFPHSSPKVPGVQGEPDDGDQGEENVE